MRIEVQIIEEYAQLRTTALHSAEFSCVGSVIKSTILISLIVIAVIPGNDGVDSEGNEIPPITIDHGGRHIGEFIAAAMHAVRQKEVRNASVLSVRANPLGSARKSRTAKAHPW